VIDSVNQGHREDIAAIDHAYETQQAVVVQAQTNYQNTVSQIEQEHEAAQVNLDDRKKKRIRQIIKQHGDNPEEITRRIAALTGLRVRGH
jgi:hypothetical protein